MQASKNQDFEESLLNQINASTQSPLNMLLNARMHQQSMQNKQAVFGQSKYGYGQQHQFQPQQPKPCDNEFTFFDTEKLLKFAIGDEVPVDCNLPSYVEQAWNSVDNEPFKSVKDEKKPDFRWMDDLSVGVHLNSLLSTQADIKPEQYSPLQDQHSASSSSSSLLSRSSFESASSSSCWAGALSHGYTYFSENDSGIDQQKLKPIKTTSKPQSRCETPQDFSLSEHLEFTCSGKSSSMAPSSSNAVQVLNKQNLQEFTQQQQQRQPLGKPGKKCSKKSTNFNYDDDLEDHIEADEESSVGNDDDTIDDASVIPTDIDVNQDNNDIVGDDDDDDICLNFDANFKEMCTMRDATDKPYSLFPEHDDKPMGFNDYAEYRLFPNMPPHNSYSCQNADLYNANVF